MAKKEVNKESDSGLSTGLIKDFLDTQRKKAENQQISLKLEEKKMEYNFKLAEKSLTMQADFIKNDPSEKRKSVLLISLIAIFIICAICFFIWLLLSNGFESFAHEILKYGSYIFVAIVSYLAGKRKSKSSDRDSSNDLSDIEEAEIVD
jgi:Fe2+ transport system protein B